MPPQVSVLCKGGIIDLLSRELHRHSLFQDQERALKTLLQIDAEILAVYDLPPKLERELLDTFQGEKRPIPFMFTGYYPDGLEAYIPLHELISREFQEARADLVLQRLVPVDDPIISAAMAQLH
jgi:hypothetical protein